MTSQLAQPASAETSRRSAASGATGGKHPGDSRREPKAAHSELIGRATDGIASALPVFTLPAFTTGAAA